MRKCVTKIKYKMRPKDLKMLLSAVKDMKKRDIKLPCYLPREKKMIKNVNRRLKHQLRYKKKSTKKTYWLLGI